MDFCVRGREGLRHDENKALSNIWKVLWYAGYLIGYFLYCNYTFRIEKWCFLQNQQKKLNIIQK